MEESRLLLKEISVKTFLNSVVIGCLFQWADEHQECLTYRAGEVIKGTNRSVNATMESGTGRIENLPAVRIQTWNLYSVDPIEESTLDRCFLFGFRDLLVEEKNFSATLMAGPFRSVFIVEDSLEYRIYTKT